MVRADHAPGCELPLDRRRARWSVRRLRPHDARRRPEVGRAAREPARRARAEGARSEEHTSELQSRPHLVCRLLLEKKKKTKLGQHHYPKQNETDKY